MAHGMDYIEENYSLHQCNERHLSFMTAFGITQWGSLKWQVSVYNHIGPGAIITIVWDGRVM